MNWGIHHEPRYNSRGGAVFTGDEENHRKEETSRLNLIAIDAELAKLDQRDREMVWMAYKYRRPDDYKGPWPVPPAEIGRYVGLKYGKKPLSARRVQQRVKELEAMWADRRRRGA